MISRSLFRYTTICLTALLLGACHTLVRESVPGEWVEIPSGSALRLHQPIQIPPGRTRAYLAAGRATTTGTSCVIEVRRLDPDQRQTIQAGRYGITRVQDYMALVSSVDRPSGADGQVRFQLASQGDSGGSQMVRFGYHFWLDARQDPNLMRLTCLGRHDAPASTRPPTLVEIQAVLGDLATLELAGAAAMPGS
ncbi:hypothetical protein [Thiocystis violascens]|uniref:Lipoprotein n=1 Tax=Thiocystis violascens (strain ATCC 17096 / DSM 198 / 6111) TaxID=765911 RepID=I3YF06_THIV6|nr:hypothetical protein [Thiocystis violascens]AFL75574.1 hypothetical protein Thivi_3727 [Thiocystis violascens DSM 198]